MRGVSGAAFREERRGERKDARERDQRVHGDAQLGFPSRRDALHAPLDLVGGGQQAATVVEQQASGGREARAVAAAVEQQHVQIVLEPAHRVGDGGRHAIEFDGGRGKAAAAVDGVENGECLERECHSGHIQKY